MYNKCLFLRIWENHAHRAITWFYPLQRIFRTVKVNSDSNELRSHNRLVRKGTLNPGAQLAGEEGARSPVPFLENPVCVHLWIKILFKMQF